MLWYFIIRRRFRQFLLGSFQPVDDRRKVVAVLSFSKMPETDELSFEKGDVFIVLNEMGDGWLWVKSLRTNEDGQIHEALVDVLVCNRILTFPDVLWQEVCEWKIDNMIIFIILVSVSCIFLMHLIKGRFYICIPHTRGCTLMASNWFQSESVEPVQGLPYFHDNLTKEQAVEKLREGNSFFNFEILGHCDLSLIA